MAQWTTGDVVTNGISMHYYRTGGDKPAVVLAHGVTDSGLCWRPVAGILQADYDIVMVDARGHGLSRAPLSGYRYDDMAADLAGLAHALHLHKPALVGHSMGAATVAAAAAAFPGLARCAVLEDPPWIIGDRSQTEREARAERFRAQLSEQQRKTRDELIALCRAQSPSWLEHELEAWAEAKLQVSPYVVELMSGTPQDWRKVAATIDCPVLLITADPERGGIVTPEVAQEAGTLLRAGRVTRIQGAGHNVRREGFQQYMAAICAFLGEHS
jgi:pimeloyl-ACP methyl ester carboxylesterase